MIVETRRLTKKYGATTALDAVDLAVPEHCVYGLVGLNGAGKTTLLSILAGLRRPTSGDVIRGAGAAEWAMCPDSPVFEPWLSAEEVVRLAGTLAGTRPTEDRVSSLLHEAGLATASARHVGGFSRGMTQRLAVAATIVTEPRLVVLDEPCSALDPAGRVEVLDLVRRAAQDATVIFSSHVLADVQRVCDVVGVLDGGRLVFQGPLTELLTHYARDAWRVIVRDGGAAAAAAIDQAGWSRNVTVAGDVIRFEASARDAAEREIAAVLAAAGASLVAFEPEEADLEAVFLEMTR